jgi:hypothetical protein
VRADAKRRFEYFARRRAELEREAEKNGKLRCSDWWRLEYFKDPYLIDSLESDLHKRYQDISGNLLVLTREGKIAPLMDNNRDVWMSRIQHVQEELFGRGLRPQRADDELHIPKPTFPDVPPGLRILKGRSLPAGQYLVKVGKAGHMKDMLEKGEVKISPVASYADKTLTTAIYDNELELIARYSSFNRDRTRLSRSAAASAIEQSSEIIARRTLPNFYLYCLTYHYDHRLLDDFQADAVVIIKKPDNIHSEADQRRKNKTIRFPIAIRPS